MIQERTAQDAEICPLYMIVILTIRIRTYPVIPFCNNITRHNNLPFFDRVFRKLPLTAEIAEVAEKPKDREIENNPVFFASFASLR
jgi:hypothetical protein